MQDSTFEDVNFSNFSSFILKVNHVFMEEKHNPLEKVVIVEKKIDYIEIDGVWNLEKLPKTMFID